MTYGSSPTSYGAAPTLHRKLVGPDKARFWRDGKSEPDSIFSMGGAHHLVARDPHPRSYQERLFFCT